MIFSYSGRHHVSAQAGACALQVHDVTLTYPGAEQAALDKVSLVVERGEKVALIGPNGAGKSTLIKAIAGQVPPDEGEMLIYGNPVGACHHRTAYVP
ncbi:MAG: ATP-binding cassette domain-containing protein, partial [Ardenticatenaceae bacterium]